MSKIYLRSRLNMAQIVYDVRNKTYQLAQNRKTGQNDEQVAHIDAGDDENALDQIRRSVESYARTLSTQFSPYLRVEHIGAGDIGSPYATDDTLGRIRVGDSAFAFATCKAAAGHAVSTAFVFSFNNHLYSLTPGTAIAQGDLLLFNGKDVFKSNSPVALGTAVETTGGTAAEAFDKPNYFDITIAMPSNYDPNMDGAITEAVHDYVVHMACYDWYLLAKPDEAQNFTARANKALDIIRQALNKRLAPSLSGVEMPGPTLYQPLITPQNPLNASLVRGIPPQVQSNWNEEDTNSPAYIQNKPTQVQSDWNETDANSPAYIKNKPSES